MKIFYSLPENMDKGDVYILGVVRVGVLGFLAISSFTVFGGFKSYSSDYMDSLYPALAWVLLFFGYWAFCFVPDFVNTMIVRYISRTILKKTYQADRRVIVVLLFSVGLVWFLTRYSYNMSHFSAEVTAKNLGGETNNTDLVKMDSLYQARVDKTQADFDREKGEIITRYDQRIAEAAGELDFKIKGEETLIAGLEKNRKKTNTVWTDQQIRLHQRRIADYQKRRKPIVSPIRAEQQKELTALNEKFDQKSSRLDHSYTISRDTTLAIEGTAGDIHQKEVDFFSQQLSGIAGKAIFFLLMLTVVREIIYDRNDIDPDPVFSPFDFQPSVALEVIAFPLTKLGRFLVNKVRRGYNNLPALIQRDDYKELTDPGQRQKVLKQKTELVSAAGETSDKNDGETETKPNPETDESFETTKFADYRWFETIDSVCARLRELKRTKQQYDWKLRNKVGKPETAEKRIRETEIEMAATIEFYWEKIAAETALKQAFQDQIQKLKLDRHLPQ